MRTITTLVLLLCASTVALADLKVTRKTGVGSYGGQTTVYVKGARERTENPGMTTIRQCDLKRTIQINERARKYLVVPDETGGGQTTAQAAVPPPQSPRQTRRGAVVTHTVNISDTGERKQMFGYTARHIKTATVMDAPPEACSPGHIEIETDGWYIDLSAGFSCDAGRPPTPPAATRERPDCQDQVRYKTTGAGKLGFPLMVTTKVKTGGQDEESSAMIRQGMTSTVEVTDISNVTLDPSLFEIPAGYAEAASAQELYAMPSGGLSGMTAGVPPPESVAPGESTTPNADTVKPKAPGTIRVGVAGINNRAGSDNVSLEGLRERLVGSIAGAGVEAVALDASEPSAADAEAKRKDCDFVLYTDLTALKQSAAGKIGGMFGRATGVSTPGAERFESRVDFRLFAVGGASQLESNATAKEEGAEGSVSAALEKEAKAVAAAARKKKS